MTTGTAPAKNTDREIWRERSGDYYAPSIHVTEEGGIGIDVGGTVIVMDVRDWHGLANRQRITELCLNEKCPRGGMPVEIIADGVSEDGKNAG